GRWRHVWPGRWKCSSRRWTSFPPRRDTPDIPGPRRTRPKPKALPKSKPGKPMQPELRAFPPSPPINRLPVESRASPPGRRTGGRARRPSLHRPTHHALMALAIREQHRVDDPQHNEESNRKRRPGEGANRLDDDWLISLLHFFLQLAGGDQLFILSGLVSFQFFQRHAPGEYGDVHGKLFRPQMGIEEMHGKDEAGGQQRLVAVNDGGDVEERSR